MRVVVCAMAKNEHLYIKDWVDHYLRIGFDKIYICDNDDPGTKSIKRHLPQTDKIEIINIRGRKEENLHHKVFTEFYKTHKFDWCLFCDVDEFLSGVQNIHIYLSLPQFRNASQVRVKWRLFGDDDKISRDMNKPVYCCFHKVITSSLSRDLKKKSNLENQGKAIVRGGLPNVVFHSPHYACYYDINHIIPSILPSGRPCWSRVAIKEDYRFESLFLNHYMTKSLSEFINQKLNRNDAVFNVNLKLDYYWRINKKTKEKLDYLKSRGLIE